MRQGLPQLAGPVLHFHANHSRVRPPPSTNPELDPRMLRMRHGCRASFTQRPSLLLLLILSLSTAIAPLYKRGTSDASSGASRVAFKLHTVLLWHALSYTPWLHGLPSLNRRSTIRKTHTQFVSGRQRVQYLGYVDRRCGTS
jgi:hypothetical protein